MLLDKHTALKAIVRPTGVTMATNIAVLLEIQQ